LDASLELRPVGEREVRHGPLGGEVARGALDGEGDDLDRFPVGTPLRLVLDLLDDRGGLVTRLGLQVQEELPARLVASQSGDALEAHVLLVRHPLELLA
jgi:hypothetical protein